MRQHLLRQVSSKKDRYFEVESGRTHFGVDRTEKPSSSPSSPSCIPRQHQVQEEGANPVDQRRPRWKITYVLVPTFWLPPHPHAQVTARNYIPRWPIHGGNGRDGKVAPELVTVKLRYYVEVLY